MFYYDDALIFSVFFNFGVVVAYDQQQSQNYKTTYHK